MIVVALESMHYPLDGGQWQIVQTANPEWAAIDWLVKNIPGHNGRVGMYGISYPGF